MNISILDFRPVGQSDELDGALELMAMWPETTAVTFSYEKGGTTYVCTRWLQNQSASEWDGLTDHATRITEAVGAKVTISLVERGRK